MQNKRQFSIVKDGNILGNWMVRGCTDLDDKFIALCRRIGRTGIWADRGRALKLMVDPPYVVYRNNGNPRRIVLVNVSEAPANYIEELAELYGW